MNKKNLASYCPNCSSIGVVPETEFNCCPDADPSYIPLDIAKQAAHGFKMMFNTKNIVSLRAAALALCQSNEAWDMNEYREKDPHPRSLALTTAVLRVAGVQYINDAG